MSRISSLVLVLAACVARGTTTLAQLPEREFERAEVKPSAKTRGALYRPTGQPAPHIGVVMMHRTADFRNHIAAREFARRGFLTLGMNSRFEGDEGAVVWEDLMLDVKAGVELLKREPGITKVVLFAHSGGGSIMACYQALAENGAAFSQGENKITQGTDQLANLPRADAVIFADAHLGIAINTLRSLNPAVTDESNPGQLDPQFDASNPDVQQRGADGATLWADDFKQRYIAGQTARMERLIAQAQSQLAAAKAAGVANPGAQTFAIAGGRGMTPAELFPNTLDRSEKPRQFLKNDGTIATEIVVQTRPRARQTANPVPRRGERPLTLQSFLTANAVRGSNSLDGIDWCSTNCATPCGAAAIGVPVLVTAMGSHTFLRDGEIIFEAVKSSDKEMIVIEGATHDFVPCVDCEETPGQFSNVTKNHFDYAAKWITSRF